MEAKAWWYAKSKVYGEIGIMRWNDVTKTKTVKFVSMMSTIHLFELIDSNKKDRHTGEVIKKPDVIIGYNKMMGGVDLDILTKKSWMVSYVVRHIFHFLKLNIAEHPL